MCRPGSPTAPPDLTEPRGVTTEAPFIDHRVGVGRSCEHNGLKGNTCMPLQPRAFLGGTCGEAREAGEEQERRWERRPLQHRHTRLAAWPWARSCLQPAQETGGGPLDEAAAQGPALGAAAALRVSQPWVGPTQLQKIIGKACVNTVSPLYSCMWPGLGGNGLGGKGCAEKAGCATRGK